MEFIYHKTISIKQTKVKLEIYDQYHDESLQINLQLFKTSWIAGKKFTNNNNNQGYCKTPDWPKRATYISVKPHDIGQRERLARVFTHTNKTRTW